MRKMNWINVILSALLTSIAVCYALINISGIRYKKVKIFLFIIFSSILLMINARFTELIKPLFSILSTIFVSYFTIFDKNLNKSIYYGLIQGIINFVLEMIITLILITIFKYSIDIYNNSKYSMLLFSIFNSSLLYFITKIKVLKTYCQKYETKILSSNIMRIYVVIMLIVIALLVKNNFINYKKSLDYYINFAMLIFVIMVSIIVLYNKITKDKIENKYKEMMEYVSKYERIINEQGKKNHEFNNQLMVLKGYIDNKKKLKEYLESIIKDHKGGKNYTIEQLSYFPDGGIKGLIYHKLSRMEENEIRPYLYISTDVKDIFETKFDINTYSDITKLFGVFLDNAIEAAKDADKKEIEIDMKIDGEYLIVTIGNTYSKDVDVNKIGKKGFTTKGIGHGFGLSLVKDISRRNPKIETFNDITNDMFKQTIMIDLK